MPWGMFASIGEYWGSRLHPRALGVGRRTGTDDQAGFAREHALAHVGPLERINMPRGMFS